MTQRIGSAASFTAALAISAVLLAAPAAADDDESFEMPDLTGESLATAESEVSGLSDETRIVMSSADLGGLARLQLSLPNWTVCGTSPGSGESFTAEDEVVFDVVRRGLESCPD